MDRETNIFDIEYEDHSNYIKKELLNKIMKSRQTVLEMLKDRGYSISSVKELNKLVDDIPSVDDLLLIDDDKKIVVFWLLGKSVDIQSFRYYFKKMDDLNINKGIFIFNGSMSDNTQLMAQDIIKKGNSIELFNLDMMILNFTRHNLVSKIKILNEEEKKVLLDKYQLRLDTQIPKILSTDPLCKYYGLKKNQVIQFDRHQKNTDNEKKGIAYLTYRIVF
jgi:DNA-directed RNA polymerase I, II, and III subunit RPABC1